MIGGSEYPINADFRDVLEIIGYLNDISRPEFIRWRTAVGLFYDGEVPDKYLHEAMEYLAEFISYGEGDNAPGPKLMDWEQDAKIIIGEVNKVAGIEVRAVPFLHWWTFLSYFYGIGEGQLSTIVSIRSKLKRGKKLEKWEREWYVKNRSAVDFEVKLTSAEEDLLKKWGGG